MPDANSITQIWESMRTSSDETSEQAKNIQYWSSLPPFAQTSNIVGNIDSIKLKGDQRLLLRGWIFSLECPITRIELSLDEPPAEWDSILASNLSRTDVAQVFPFAPQAAFCGFVLARAPGEIALGQEITAHFRISLLNGEQRTGYFSACPVTRAISG